MSKLYCIDVRVYATAYIRADSPEEARLKAQALSEESLLVSDGDELIRDGGYESLPEVSLSPAMTIVGPAADDLAEEVAG